MSLSYSLFQVIFFILHQKKIFFIFFALLTLRCRSITLQIEDWSKIIQRMEKRKNSLSIIILLISLYSSFTRSERKTVSESIPSYVFSFIHLNHCCLRLRTYEVMLLPENETRRNKNTSAEVEDELLTVSRSLTYWWLSYLSLRMMKKNISFFFLQLRWPWNVRTFIYFFAEKDKTQGNSSH